MMLHRCEIVAESTNEHGGKTYIFVCDDLPKELDNHEYLTRIMKPAKEAWEAKKTKEVSS